MMRVWRLSVWRLSVAYIGPKSRTKRPRKTKIGTEVAHVTRDSDTTFKVKRSKVNLQGAGAYCGGLPHILFFLLFFVLIPLNVIVVAQCLYAMMTSLFGLMTSPSDVITRICKCTAVGPPTALLSESGDGRGPSSPRQLTALSVLSTSVTLSWQPPSTSASLLPVIGYIVYWRESGSRRWTIPALIHLRPNISLFLPILCVKSLYQKAVHAQSLM